MGQKMRINSNTNTNVIVPILTNIKNKCGKTDTSIYFIILDATNGKSRNKNYNLV